MTRSFWAIGAFAISTGFIFAGVYDDNSAMKVPVSADMTKDEKLWQMKEALLKADKQCRPQTQLYNRNGTPEHLAVMGPNGTVSDVVRGDVGSVSYGSIEKGSIVLHTHPMDSTVKVERTPDGQHYSYSNTALGPSGADIRIAKETHSTVLALDCASGKILGVDANGNAVEVMLDEKNKTASVLSLAYEKRSQQLEIDDQKSMTRDFSQEIADQRLQEIADQKPYREEVGTKSSNEAVGVDVLHSLSDLLETGEELVEVREDMREDRRERKAREQAERERRQQLAEQRKPAAQAEQKKSTPSQTAKQPASTTKSTAQSESIDFSRLNGIINSQISLVRGILSSGEKASDAQKSQFNSLSSQYQSEFDRLKAQISNVSDSTKQNQYYNELANVNRRINSELDPLLAQGQSQGLFVNL